MYLAEIAAATAAGVGSGIHGGVKMKEANDNMKSVDARHKKNIARFETRSSITSKVMDKPCEIELKVLNSFEI